MGSTSGSAQDEDARAGGVPGGRSDRRRTPRVGDRRGRRRGRATFWDLVYDGFYSAAIGGSVLGLYFLLIDLVAHRPLFTPALLGSVLFGGSAADSVTRVRLDMAAYFILVHFGLFGALGTSLAIVVSQVRTLVGHPLRMIGLLLLVLEGGFLLAESLFLPGIVEMIGLGRITVGNVLTASSMALFMLKAENPRAWERLLQGKPLTS